MARKEWPWLRCWQRATIPSVSKARPEDDLQRNASVPYQIRPLSPLIVRTEIPWLGLRLTVSGVWLPAGV